MIRLFSILILSLSFIGSANANSIKGAFGYELGQVVSDVTVKDWGDSFSASKYFKPNKPFLNFNKYWLSTTLTEKKVFFIIAIFEEQSTMEDKCYSNSSDYARVLRVLEEKYGDFRETKNSFYSYGDSQKQTVRSHEIREGARLIGLYCNWFYDFEQPSDFLFTMDLSYKDLDLSIRAEIESLHLVQEGLKDSLEGVEY
jgi:hypothetical protein